MDPDVRSFAQVAVIIVGMVASLVTIGLVAWRVGMGGRRKDAELPASHSRQLEELQSSVDAIAIEVERIAEAQRFSARLLSERAEVATPPVRH